MKTIILKKNEERRLLAGHLWVYSNEIDTKITKLRDFIPGELVYIKNSQNKNLGVGYINPHTLLCARLLTRDTNQTIDCDFFITKIQQALLLRQMCFAKPFYRVIFSESDYLSGLVVDRFGDVLVAQFNTFGMENLKDFILEALVEVLKPKAIWLRNNSSIRVTETLPSYVELAYGSSDDSIEFEENNIRFIVPIKEGQKTGWFYDQRNNRAHLAPYVDNKSVLDIFSYSGSFGINAAIYGARQVTCIDASEFAIDQVKQNALLNNVADKVDVICDDAFAALKKLDGKQASFDVIILDPPAFIKRRKDIEIGTKAYLRAHRAALKLLKPNGILLTTSCSMHLPVDALLDVLRQAALQENRQATVITQLHQGQDHPIHPAIVETNYLKGFIVHVR